MSELRHTYLQGPWYYCGVTDEKVKVADAQWQRGVLKCPAAVDKMLLGDRERQIELVLEDGKEELAPVEKLRQPFEYTETEDFSL
jgi:hypothetical protein